MPATGTTLIDNVNATTQGGSAIAFDGPRTWFTNQGNTTAIIISGINHPTRGGVNPTIISTHTTVDTAPDALVWDGANTGIANSGSNTVTRVGSTGQVNYDVGIFPDALTFDGINIWVGNASHSTLTEITPP